ncbi:hypothetical protein DV515_00007590 [Chloebia gouldiae]|uniref:Uncharacterized protein n=1 Tax=Chloebia gouldiae TaxID=44316 RepID=A0A3L8SI56_CHLGU|nr:hypothetical protein DV515_00007590 [Chloebia gouldiae]
MKMFSAKDLQSYERVVQPCVSGNAEYLSTGDLHCTTRLIEQLEKLRTRDDPDDDSDDLDDPDDESVIMQIYVERAPEIRLWPMADMNIPCQCSPPEFYLIRNLVSLDSRVAVLYIIVKTFRDKVEHCRESHSTSTGKFPGLKPGGFFTERRNQTQDFRSNPLPSLKSISGQKAKPEARYKHSREAGGELVPGAGMKEKR